MIDNRIPVILVSIFGIVLCAYIIYGEFKPKRSPIKKPILDISGVKPVLDISGIALAEMIKRLYEVIAETEQSQQYTLELVVTMVRSIRIAYAQTISWRLSMALNRTPDPLVTKSVSVVILDAIKLSEVGSKEWFELKTELDEFHKLFQGETVVGGSIPPPTDITAV